MKKLIELIAIVIFVVICAFVINKAWIYLRSDGSEKPVPFQSE